MLYVFPYFQVYCVGESISLKDVGNVVETGQKEQLYFRTAENSCQKYVFGRMYGKLSLF